MAINALLPVVGASKGIAGQVIKATLVFGPAINRTGSPAKVKPVHLYQNAEPEIVLGLVDGVAAALNALDAQVAQPARRTEQLRTGVCDSAQLHTHHGSDAILISSLVDPLDSVFSLYAPIGAGVYHFDSTGALKSRRTGRGEEATLPVIPPDYHRIFLSDGLTDRFLSIRQDACRTTIEDLCIKRRMSSAARDRLASVLINAGRISACDSAFPSSRILAALLIADGRMAPEAGASMVGSVMPAERAVAMDW
jgi:hypothetical protein